MLFNSYSFILFFLGVLLFLRLPLVWNLKKSFLLAVSYLFYAAWNPPFVILIWISTLVDWFVAKGISRCASVPRRKGLLVISLISNLGLLAAFKYGDFLISTANEVLGFLGFEFVAGEMNILLPVGISFYTFQTLSYTIDVYRKDIDANASFLDFALFVTFFPQLVAGPIVRAKEFLPQCEKPRVASVDQIGYGMYLFVIGLFAKVVVADVLMSPIVEAVFLEGTSAGFLTSWTGVLAFSMQIFYDFFGYSICAIGVAMCIGFELPDNFKSPYSARGVSDFWKRWHISLSSWLRDYLYISLGGNRFGIVKTNINLLVTMLLGGLWHGASWMFVIWGGMHGIFLVMERVIRASVVGQLSVWRTTFGEIFIALITFILICFSWVFFRSESLEMSFALCSSMLDLSSAFQLVISVFDENDSLSTCEGQWLDMPSYMIVLATTGFTLIFHHIMRNSNLETQLGRLPWFVHGLLISTLSYLILISMSGSDLAFIYFQF